MKSQNIVSPLKKQQLKKDAVPVDRSAPRPAVQMCIRDSNTEDQNDEISSNSKIESVNEFDTTTLTRSQQKAVHSIRQIINDHLTDKDLEGALRDLQGNPVPKGTTGYWDHVQEVKDAYTGLRRGKNSIEGSLKNPNLPKEHRIFLQEQLDIINQYIEKIAEIFEMYGGI